MLVYKFVVQLQCTFENLGRQISHYSVLVSKLSFKMHVRNEVGKLGGQQICKLV